MKKEEDIDDPNWQPFPEKTTSQPKLTKCPDCGREISIQAATCPHCGRKLKQSATGVLAAIILGLLGAAFLLSMMSQCGQ